jgi:hypothetical protein
MNFHKFEVTTAARMTMFWVVTRIYSEADTNVSEKCHSYVGTCESIRSHNTEATSALKMETVCSSETLISTRESTQRHNPEEQHPVELCSYNRHTTA